MYSAEARGRQWKQPRVISRIWTLSLGTWMRRPVQPLACQYQSCATVSLHSSHRVSPSTGSGALSIIRLHSAPAGQVKVGFRHIVTDSPTIVLSHFELTVTGCLCLSACQPCCGVWSLSHTCLSSSVCLYVCMSVCLYVFVINCHINLMCVCVVSPEESCEFEVNSRVSLILERCQALRSTRPVGWPSLTQCLTMAVYT